MHPANSNRHNEWKALYHEIHPTNYPKQKTGQGKAGKVMWIRNEQANNQCQLMVCYLHHWCEPNREYL
jgi:hypothetical protein